MMITDYDKLIVFQLLFSACSGSQKGIGFKELVCGLVLLTRGRQEEKLKCKIT
jgi:ubiquitin carboxyl-terminal hydrolase 6/32